MTGPITWHRLFGLTWEDFFRSTAVRAKSEKDLSTQQQRLDVVLVRGEHSPLERTMPNGMQDLAAPNLITFKSKHEALDAWSLKGLMQH